MVDLEAQRNCVSSTAEGDERTVENAGVDCDRIHLSNIVAGATADKITGGCADEAGASKKNDFVVAIHKELGNESRVGKGLHAGGGESIGRVAGFNGGLKGRVGVTGGGEKLGGSSSATVDEFSTESHG